MALTIKDLVKDTTAEFIYFCKGNLWYKINGVVATESEHAGQTIDFEFPVPVTETEDGIFPPTIKAITLMKWVRQQLADPKKSDFH